MSHHTAAPPCPLCEDKIKEGHPKLQEIWPEIKKQFPDAHLSWVFRNEEMQNLFFSEGKTRARFPDSFHNHLQNGQPQSRAMDLFQIGSDQVARWDRRYFEKIAQFCEGLKLPLEWSGNWVGFKEQDHFQLDKTVV